MFSDQLPPNLRMLISTGKGHWSQTAAIDIVSWQMPLKGLQRVKIRGTVFHTALERTGAVHKQHTLQLSNLFEDAEGSAGVPEPLHKKVFLRKWKRQSGSPLLHL